MYPNQSAQVPQLRQTEGNKAKTLEVTVMSFGYKEGPPPLANMVFDVRFLKNPFWVPELRPLSGLDQAVQDYVLKQPLAIEFIESLTVLLNSVLPRFAELELTEFAIAFGCTGGQHRSAAIAEALADRIAATFPPFHVVRVHRQLTSDLPAASALFRDEDGMAVEAYGVPDIAPDTVPEKPGAPPLDGRGTGDVSGDGGDGKQ